MLLVRMKVQLLSERHCLAVLQKWHFCQTSLDRSDSFYTKKYQTTTGRCGIDADARTQFLASHMLQTKIRIPRHVQAPKRQAARVIHATIRSFSGQLPPELHAQRATETAQVARAPTRPSRNLQDQLWRRGGQRAFELLRRTYRRYAVRCRGTLKLVKQLR
jgi:hypothetical protein